MLIAFVLVFRLGLHDAVDITAVMRRYLGGSIALDSALLVPTRYVYAKQLLLFVCLLQKD